MGNAAVTGDWVGGKVGKENTDKLTGKNPEKGSGPRSPVLRRVPVSLPLLRPKDQEVGWIRGRWER